MEAELLEGTHALIAGALGLLENRPDPKIGARINKKFESCETGGQAAETDRDRAKL
ncbi:hypothetical protein SDC9_144642 [bioreactor metagenome]|uniref:Uncharacterized protein n=2 Tax=root TaxID=1 RepID=A0A645E7R1_9ZZZZ